MQILVCNDDGVNSPLIRLLAKKLTKYGVVAVCAPDGERSASSQAINYRDHFASNIKDLGVIDGVRYFSHPHYPTDSLLYILDFTNFEPDLVVSGINRGLNVGIDIYYSGTVGIATEAAIRGYNTFALSIDKDYKESDLKFLDEILDKVINEKLYSNEYILNINLPIDSNSLKYKYTEIDLGNSSNSDIDAVKNKFVSLTPLIVNRTDLKALKK